MQHADPPPPASLRRDYLHLPELIAQSIGLVAVSGGVGVLIPAVFATAGNGTWLAFVFAMVALLFSSWSITLFARNSASPGALYSYAALGLGPIWGVVGGWALLVAYGFSAAGILPGTVNSLLAVARDLGLASGPVAPRPILLLTVLTALAAWIIAWRDIRFSTRFTLLVELGTLALIAIVLGAALCAPGAHVDHAQITLAHVQPRQIRLGMVLAFFSFTGFESATALGAEARDPLRAIPQAMRVSIIGPALFFIFAAYTLVSAFQGATPPLDRIDAAIAVLARRQGLGGLGTPIDVGIALSFFAALFSSINAAARIIYSFARQGLLHAAAGRAHPDTATPHIAVTLLVGAVLLVNLPLLLNGTSLLDSYGYLSSIATYGYLLSYLLVAISAPVWLYRQRRLSAGAVVISLLSVVFLAIPLIGSIYPAPTGVYALLPYIFLGLIGLGLVWFLLLRLFAPNRLHALEAALGRG